MPEISVLVPNYNHAPYLQQRLDSIFNQTFQDFEVIILDDRSTDNSVEILAKYNNNPKVSHFLVNEKNSGSPYKQWKKGIELAQGKYVWIAESDDWARPDFLQTLIQRISNNENVNLAYCQSNILKKGNIVQTKDWSQNTLLEESFETDFYIEGDTFNELGLSHKCLIFNVSSSLVKKISALEAFRNNKLKRFKYSYDWYFYCLVCASGKVAYSAKSMNHFNRLDLSYTLQNQYHWMRLREELFILKQYCPKAAAKSLINHKIHVYLSNPKSVFSQIMIMSVFIFALFRFDHKIIFRLLNYYTTK